MAHSESNQSRSRSASSHKSAKFDDKKRQSYDQSENDCLYIGNIDKKLSQEKLTAVFAEQGELQYCYIVYEPYSTADRSNRTQPKQSRGYGFAKYRNQADAVKAREKLQGTDFNGRKITVEFSKRGKPREPTPGRYLGKKRSSPVHRSHHRRSYSRSSSRSPQKSHKKSSRRYHEKNHEKKRRHQRSRSDSYRRRRSYSKSPRR